MKPAPYDDRSFWRPVEAPLEVAGLTGAWLEHVGDPSDPADIDLLAVKLRGQPNPGGPIFEHLTTISRQTVEEEPAGAADLLRRRWAHATDRAIRAALVGQLGKRRNGGRRAG